MKILPDITGNKYGRLTVIEKVKRNGVTHWRCKCDCGNEAIVVNAHLVSGYTQSCGCLRSDFCKSDKINRIYIDGRIHERLYHIYHGMIDRCYNPNNVNFSSYGGRGIIVCELWKNSYEDFREWAFKSGYGEKLTIDRIDVNGNYEPSNCRWVGVDVQNYNKRNTVRHKVNGAVYTFSELAQKYGLDLKRLRYAYYDHNKDIIYALRVLGIDSAESG